MTKHGNRGCAPRSSNWPGNWSASSRNIPRSKKRFAILAPGAEATGAARQKAIVAVARQLAVDLWRWQTGQCTAEKLGLRP